MKSNARTRRCHSKVRTGCSTCKTRRKKCDEAKPSCRRCIAAGLKCDGYDNVILSRIGVSTVNCPSKSSAVAPNNRQDYNATRVSPSSNENSGCRPPCELVASDNKNQQSIGITFLEESLYLLSRQPNALAELHQASDLEVHCYSYFRLNTVPRLATYFEKYLWRMNLKGNAVAAVHHPALFRAAAAVGAVHRRFCYGICREAFEYCAHAARLYKAAVETLDGLKRRNSTQSCQRVISACEALLGIFQSFQANSGASSMHIRSGVQATIGAPSQLLHTESWYYARLAEPRLLCGILYQLYCRTTEFHGEPSFIHTPDNTYYTPSTKMPMTFKSLREMSYYLFDVLISAWDGHDLVLDLLARRRSIEVYEDLLHDWTQACMRTLHSGLIIDSGQFQAWNLLNLTHSAVRVSVQGLLLTTDRSDMRPVPHLPIFGASDDNFSEAAAQLCAAVDYMYTIKDADLSHVKSMVQQTLAGRQIFSFGRTSIADAVVSGPSEIQNLWTIAKRVGQVEDDALLERVKEILPRGAMNAHIADIWPDKRVLQVRYFEADPCRPGFRCVQQSWLY